MKQPVGVILAGGRATRMGGGDKCLLPLGEGRVIDQILARLTPQVGAILLNANGDPARFDDLQLSVVPDADNDFAGPLSGVLAGLDAAATLGADAIVTVAGDTPFFPDYLVNALSSAAYAQDKPLAMAMTPDPDRGLSRHPTFGLWPVSLREDLRAALAAGTRKVIAWTEPHGCARAVFETDPFDPFFNINTPEDLAKAEALRAEHHL